MRESIAGESEVGPLWYDSWDDIDLQVHTADPLRPFDRPSCLSDLRHGILVLSMLQGLVDMRCGLVAL